MSVLLDTRTCISFNQCCLPVRSHRYRLSNQSLECFITPWLLIFQISELLNVDFDFVLCSSRHLVALLLLHLCLPCHLVTHVLFWQSCYGYHNFPCLTFILLLNFVPSLIERTLCITLMINVLLMFVLLIVVLLLPIWVPCLFWLSCSLYLHCVTYTVYTTLVSCCSCFVLKLNTSGYYCLFVTLSP